MKNKDVVIALIVSLVVIGGTIIANPTSVGNNEVSEIPVASADVPLATEFPSFKYSLKPMTFNVQKEAEATKKEEEVTIASVKNEDETRYYDIPLSQTMQKFVFETAQKEDISYELVLAIMAVESDYNAKAVSYDDSSRGLMQVNTKTTFYPMAKEVGIGNPNVFNAEHNVMAGVHYLATLRDAWKNNSSEADLINHVISSYRWGVMGSKRHSLNNPYVNKVRSIKSQLEKGEYAHE